MGKKTRDNPLGLDPFDGMAIGNANVAIDNAGGGLNHVLEVDATLVESLAKIKIGDTCFVILRLDCVGKELKPMKKSEDKLNMKLKFRATDTVFTDDDLAGELINSQIDRVNELKELQANGQTEKMFGPDGKPLNGDPGPTEPT